MVRLVMTAARMDRCELVIFSRGWWLGFYDWPEIYGRDRRRQFIVCTLERKGVFELGGVNFFSRPPGFNAQALNLGLSFLQATLTVWV
jgi:hypothetical protein